MVADGCEVLLRMRPRPVNRVAPSVRRMYPLVVAVGETAGATWAPCNGSNVSLTPLVSPPRRVCGRCLPQLELLAEFARLGEVRWRGSEPTTAGAVS